MGGGGVGVKVGKVGEGEGDGEMEKGGGVVWGGGMGGEEGYWMKGV